ncbi:hypothetical protein HAALTHF_25480n [Vreelandella aquamarina]|nr:hypothetical protein HAALTHF_25480n [Halomonas axialensis]
MQPVDRHARAHHRRHLYRRGQRALVIPSLTGPLLDLAGAGAFPILLATLWLLIALGLLLLASRLRQLAVRQGG